MPIWSAVLVNWADCWVWGSFVVLAMLRSQNILVRDADWQICLLAVIVLCNDCLL